MSVVNYWTKLTCHIEVVDRKEVYVVTQVRSIYGFNTLKIFLRLFRNGIGD